MTKTEFTAVVKALRTFYAKENLLPNEESVELWYRALKDLEYPAVSAALNRWVQLSKWAPTIADIRESVLAILNPPSADDWAEGWGSVLRAISRYGYSRPVEAIATLDEVSAEVVRCLGWQNLCEAENISVERANFRKTFEVVARRRKETAQLSPAVRELIASVQLPSLGSAEPPENRRLT